VKRRTVNHRAVNIVLFWELPGWCEKYMEEIRMGIGKGPVWWEHCGVPGSTAAQTTRTIRRKETKKSTALLFADMHYLPGWG